MNFNKKISFEKAVQFLFLLLLYCAASALVMDRFMTYNGAINQSHGGGFDKYLQHEVARPFAYRVLIPMVVDVVEPRITPNLSDSMKYKFTTGTPLREYMGISDAHELDLSTSIKYHLAYFICFASLVCLLLMLRAVANEVAPADLNLSNFSPLLFALLLPMTFLHGGYVYDFPELLFLSAALLSMMKGNFLALCVITPFAILNKESNVLIPIFYAVYAWRSMSPNKYICNTLTLSLISAFAYGFGHLATSDTGGVVVMHHLAGNLSFMIDYKSYFIWERLYGGLIAFPRGYNIITVAIFSSITWISWKHIEAPAKRLFVFIFAVNLYLVLFHGNRDEIRNWSLIFPVFYLFIVRFFSLQSIGLAVSKK